MCQQMRTNLRAYVCVSHGSWAGLSHVVSSRDICKPCIHSLCRGNKRHMNSNTSTPCVRTKRETCKPCFDGLNVLNEISTRYVFTTSARKEDERNTRASANPWALACTDDLSSVCFQLRQHCRVCENRNLPCRRLRTEMPSILASTPCGTNISTSTFLHRPRQ